MVVVWDMIRASDGGVDIAEDECDHLEEGAHRLMADD